MTQIIVAQILGLCGAAGFVISYQIKSNRALYFTQMVACAMFCIQFILLGAYSGCFNLTVIIIRNIMLMKISTSKWIAWKGWPWIITGIGIIGMIITWEGFISIFPFIALTGATFGYWTNNARAIRASSLFFAAPAWLIYDICVGSIGGTINESIGIISILVSIYRYGWKNLGEEDFGNKKEVEAYENHGQK